VLIAAAPFLGFFGTFTALCLWECTVLPWFTLFLGPLAALICAVGARRLANRTKWKK
jgi:hypothetical protein